MIVCFVKILLFYFLPNFHNLHFPCFLVSKEIICIKKKKNLLFNLVYLEFDKLMFLRMLLLVFFTFFTVNVWAQDEFGSNITFDDFEVITEEQLPDVKPSKEVKTIEKTDKKRFFSFGKKKDIEEKEESYLDEFFNKSVKLVDDLKKKGSNSIGQFSLQEEKKKKKKKEVVVSFPDPFFYDAIYEESDKFITYSYIYNDKTNKDNRHIPRLQNYDIIADLFKLVKAIPQRDKFYEVFKLYKSDKNSNINIQDKFGNTLLLTAMRNANFEAFFFLLSQGADVDLCNERRICPIQIAVYGNNVDLVSALSQKNVDIRVQDKNGVSVLYYAIYQRQIRIVEILLERYMRYPKNQKERQDLIEFASNSGLEDLSIKMQKMFEK